MLPGLYWQHKTLKNTFVEEFYKVAFSIPTYLTIDWFIVKDEISFSTYIWRQGITRALSGNIKF